MRTLDDVEELFYIIEGRGKLTFDGKPVEVEAGDVVFMPAGVTHSVINEYDETYVALCGRYCKSGAIRTISRKRSALGQKSS